MQITSFVRDLGQNSMGNVIIDQLSKPKKCKAGANENFAGKGEKKMWHRLFENLQV